MGLINEDEPVKENENKNVELPWLFPSPSSLTNYTPQIHDILKEEILKLSLVRFSLQEILTTKKKLVFNIM